MAVRTYAGYSITEHAWEPETHYNRVIAGNVVVHVAQRMVESITWEATTPRDDPDPGPQNPGNLNVRDGWHMQSCRCTNPLDAPDPKHIVETWVREGQWEEIDSWEEPQ